MKITPSLKRLIRDALAEDIGSGDATSQAIFGASARSRGRIVARASGVVCGVDLASEVFRQCDRSCRVRVLARDRTKVRPGTPVLAVEGSTRSILGAERTALNFLQRLSGIATLTARFVQAAGTGRCRIMDTRKTTPGWRVLEKFAVRCGGGTNHRFGLDELVLIKDNHLASLQGHADPIAEAVARARKKYPRLKVEVECDDLRQVRAAVRAQADIILLDNMSPARARAAVQIIRGRAKVEASGNMTLPRVRRMSRTGVDCISIGALTHSAPALDFSLETRPAGR